MDYLKDILERLVGQAERRATPGEKDLTLSITEKNYAGYRDPFDTVQEPLDAAVEQLEIWGLVTGKKDVQGYYKQIRMPVQKLPAAYERLGRRPKSELLDCQKRLLTETLARTAGVAHSFCESCLARLAEGRPPDHGIGTDCEKLADLLLILEKLESLDTETYVRNFSEALFHDSKRFQKLQSTVESILFELTPEAADKKTILEQYNLFQNPPYLYLKGGWLLTAGGKTMDVSCLPGGIGLPSRALPALTGIGLSCDRVISVENLTTYHDTEESGCAVLYLGGFQNSCRTDFLKLLYRCVPQAEYFHRGDLDPYGFLILETLKEKTGIPFEPMEMDLDTLRRCYEAGHYKPLDKEDQKAMQMERLKKYAELFDFMQEHDCKIEQECFEAMKLRL